MRDRDFLISLPERRSGFRCFGKSSISFSITLMTVANFEEAWGRALDVALDGGAQGVVLDGETLGVAPEGVPKGGALKEAPDDGTLEVDTEGGALEVVTDGGALRVDSLLFSVADGVSIITDVCTSACTIMVSLSGKPAGFGEEGILSVGWMGLSMLEDTRVW